MNEEKLRAENKKLRIELKYLLQAKKDTENILNHERILSSSLMSQLTTSVKQNQLGVQLSCSLEDRLNKIEKNLIKNLIPMGGI